MNEYIKRLMDCGMSEEEAVSVCSQKDRDNLRQYVELFETVFEIVYAGVD